VPLISWLRNKLRHILSSSWVSCLHYKDWSTTQFHKVLIRKEKRKTENSATPVLSMIECLHILKQQRLLRKIETSNSAFTKLCFIKHSWNLSLYSEHTAQEVVSNSTSSWMKVNNDYKKNLKSPKMLKTWVINLIIHRSTCFIWVHEKFVWMQLIYDFETHSSKLVLSKLAYLLLASIMSAVTPQTLRDLNPSTDPLNCCLLWQYL
jgi:hypothetical protein